MKTKSEQIRKFSMQILKFTKFNLEYKKGIYGLNSENDIDGYLSFFNTIKYSQSDIMLNFGQSKNFLSEKDSRLTKVFLTLITIQLYTDLLRKLRYESSIKQIFDSNDEILKEMIEVQDYETILEIFDNPKISVESIKALEQFNDLPAYKKVLEYKSLKSGDIEKLSKLNPLFLEEYQKFNVEVNENFIINQIEKWFKKYPENHDVAYIEASKFLFDLYKINGDSNFLCLLCSDIDCVNCACKFDMENKDKKQNNNEELIYIKGVPLTKKVIREMLEIYYEKYNDRNSNFNSYTLTKDFNKNDK